MNRPSFADAMASRPIVLDGGLASRLEVRGNDVSSDLWSAALLIERPDEIVAAHRDFFGAGARVAITASYQASFEGLARIGLDRDAAAELMRTSVRLADQARREAVPDDSAWIAVSVGPYGAVLADGSEYRGDYGLSVAELRQWHRRRFEVLASTVGPAGPGDVLAIETIPCAAEAEAVLAELDGTGVPAWLSLTCTDGRTRAGEDVATVFAMARDLDEIVAVGVNCCAAPEVADLLAVAVSASGKPGIAYPNSGEEWVAATRSWRGAPTVIPGLVDDWLAAGAGAVGGCCRVGVDEISAVAGRVASRRR